MNELVLDSQQIKDNTVRLLVFDVGKLTLALPIARVQKVIKYGEVYGSGLSYVNLIHWHDREITVIDLYQKLFKISQSDAKSRKYVIIARNTSEELLGIVVSQLPTSIEVSQSRIRVIPDSYRNADTLEIASHVAIVSLDGRSQTIFVLDLERSI